MSDPYKPAKPNDPILAETWNDMQRAIRDHISNHTHTGGADAGALLTGASLDEGSTLKVDKVIAASSLSVKGVDVGPRLEALASEKLDVSGGRISGLLTIGGGYATSNNYMAKGSLTIGDINADFGGGNGWNASTAGLLLEASKSTEIAVHDSGTRLASVMFYEGDGKNRITIGRDMGWGPLDLVNINSKLNVARDLAAQGPMTVTGEATFQAKVTAGKGLYVTTTCDEGAKGVELRHTNETQGIGFGFNTIYATGSNANQDLGLLARGNGKVVVKSPLQITGNASIDGDLTIGASKKISSPGRLHIAGEEILYLLNKSGVMISKAWGGNGNLTVEGDVALGGGLRIGSNYAMSSPDQPIRMVWGFVNSAAGIVSGKGYSVKTEGDGFRVTFNTAFAERPCVVAVQHWNGSIADNVVVYEINTGNCLIKTGDGNGKPSLRHFCFVAIGP